MALARFLRYLWRGGGDTNGEDRGELVAKLKLPSDTSRFVLGLVVVGDPGSVVYVLGSYDLSPRAVEDAQRLIQAAMPASVVVQGKQSDLVSRDRIIRELDEGRAFVPDSVFSFLKACLINELTVSDCQGAAAADAVRIFLGTLASPMLAAKQAAAACDSAFSYLEIPVPEQNPNSIETSPSRGEPLGFKGIARHLAQVTGANSGNLTQDFLVPEFASEFVWDTFISLDEVNRMIPGIGSTDACSALRTVHKVLEEVQNGGEVKLDELSLVCRYRLSVEYSRLVLEDLNKWTVEETPTTALDFKTLSEEDQCNVLLARALHNEAVKSKTVVAVVNPNRIPGLRKYWKAVQSSSSPELDELVKEYLVPAAGPGPDCENTSTGTVDKPKSKLLFELGGFTAALLGAAKLVTSKRGALNLASKVVLPGKFPSMAKLSSFFWQMNPASTAASVAVGKIKARSLSAMEKGFYGVMRSRHGLPASRWPWLLFGGTMLAGGPLFWYEHRLQLTLEALPSARSVARLGRGIKNLKTTAERLEETEDSQFWRDVYSILYRSYKSTG